MTLSPDIRARIRRLFYGEHWKVGTIAAQLDVHPDAVRHAIDSGVFCNAGRCPPSALDVYVEFVRETLERYPRLTGTRLHEMLRERGYQGSVVQLRRRIVALDLRPRPRSEAFFRLQCLPGEQGQVDWAYYGTLRVGRAERKVWVLVIVLAWSRGFDAYFSFEQTEAAVQRGHMDAFEEFGGVPRTLLYDNMKTVVLEREGDAIRFHPRLLELSAHYLFSPQPCRPARPTEKPRVERRIRDLRTSFFPGREFRDLADMKAQFRRWRDDVAYQRPCPTKPELTVAQALDEERPRLLPLPLHRLDAEESRTVVARRQPYVRFDTNLYSMPHTLVGVPLLLRASDTHVRLLRGDEQVARHERCWDKGCVIEDPQHLEGLAEEKQRAAARHGRDRLISLIPEAAALYAALVEREEPLGPHTAVLLRLLDRYRLEDLRGAILEAVDRGTPRAASVQSILDRRQREAHRPVQPPVRVSDRPEIQNLRVRNHSLEDYDDLIDDRPRD